MCMAPVFMWGRWFDMNWPIVPPPGSGIQVQLPPPGLYKASHVLGVNVRPPLTTKRVHDHLGPSSSPARVSPRPVDMRLDLQTLVCCCVLTAVLPLTRSSSAQPSTGMKRRLKVRLLSQMKKETAGEVPIEPSSQGGDTQVARTPSSSSLLNIRPRRSTLSKTSGCFLFTCAYHDLIHRLHQIRDFDQRAVSAPQGKMGSTGYGRRRRSLSQQEAGRGPGRTAGATPGPQTADAAGNPCCVCLLTADEDKFSHLLARLQ
ncbi:uncharacterized protein admb isoform X1 [Nerophis lumbriciformis]|uniref:uncharacterized protein admb isoform X1 n=2 Tax=Nerophis lumbriciformis TaxID=546530 RepID=UPI002AE0486F|nr:uncharacterized protein admb isoform X1 [Nerophis lumbriciformis]XP_061780749.1 uncharacterized protein admb isoform X1 [Nerophis lumbriciformis]